MSDNNKLNISSLCFDMVIDNIAIEGEDKYLFTGSNTKTNNADLIQNLSKETICEFLEYDETKVFVVKNQIGQYDLVAHNTMSNETVRVTGIGHHFVAFINIVKDATKKRRELSKNPDAQILSHDLIKRANEELLLNRYGEVGIGEYRALDYYGRPVEVCLGEYDENGDKKPIKCITLETSANGNIEKKMDELIAWANEAFKSKDNTIENVAEFHARFIKIHPFRDGNGRVCRLLTNYLLLVNGHHMINIPLEKKANYNLCLDYANATTEELFREEKESFKEFDDKMIEIQGKRTDENKYLPLAGLFKQCLMKGNSRAIINRIINYNSGNNATQDKFHADQISPLGE